MVLMTLDVWGDFFKNLLTPELKREASRENTFLLDLEAVASDCGALGTGLGSARKASVAMALGGCPVASFFSLFSSSCSPALLLLMRWWLVWAIMRDIRSFPTSSQSAVNVSFDRSRTGHTWRGSSATAVLSRISFLCFPRSMAMRLDLPTPPGP